MRVSWIVAGVAAAVALVLAVLNERTYAAWAIHAAAGALLAICYALMVTLPALPIPRWLRRSVVVLAMIASCVVIAVALSMFLWVALKKLGAFGYDPRHGNFYTLLTMMIFGGFPGGVVAGVVIGVNEAQKDRLSNAEARLFQFVAAVAYALTFAKWPWGLVHGAVAFIVARGLAAEQKWARWLAYAQALVALVHFPFGTAFGVMALLFLTEARAASARPSS